MNKQTERPANASKADKMGAGAAREGACNQIEDAWFVFVAPPAACNK